MNERIAYLAVPIDGKWDHHPKLALATLQILCGDLRKNGLVKKITTTTGDEFQFPKPNLLALKDFFGTPSDWNEVVREIEILKENTKFANALENTSFYRNGYYIARIVDSEKQAGGDQFIESLPSRLFAFADMHDVFVGIVPRATAIATEKETVTPLHP